MIIYNLDTVPKASKFVHRSNEIDQATLVRTMATQAEIPSRHLVITVHGIGTFGQWQARLEELLNSADPQISVHSYTYGFISIVAFMIPLLRWFVTRRFRNEMLHVIQSENWERIDLVAHSFGTHMIGWGLMGVQPEQRPHIHTIVFAGSVLNTNFPWKDLLGSYVGRVINECGIDDSVLILNQLIVPFSGMAGRVGFNGMVGENFVNRYHKFGHGGYFRHGDGDDFMADNWIPLLTTDEQIRRVDERVSPSHVQSIVIFILNNLEPIKLILAVTPFVLATLWIFGLYQGSEAAKQRAEEQTIVAESERDRAEEQALIAHSRFLSIQALNHKDAQLDLALLLALEALHINPALEIKGSLLDVLGTNSAIITFR